MIYQYFSYRFCTRVWNTTAWETTLIGRIFSNQTTGRLTKRRQKYLNHQPKTISPPRHTRWREPSDEYPASMSFRWTNSTILKILSLQAELTALCECQTEQHNVQNRILINYSFLYLNTVDVLVSVTPVQESKVPCSPTSHSVWMKQLHHGQLDIL